MVRIAAERHCAAIAAGDLDSALVHVVKEGRGEIGENLARVIHLVEAAEVESIRMDGEEAIVHLRFMTSDPHQPEVRVESHWAEDDQHPLLYLGYQV